MGPAILLDKSAIEAISREAVYVQQRYFYTVLAPVLIWEICGDIEKSRIGKCDEKKVRSLACKAKPMNSVVCIEWRRACIAELVGYKIEIGKGESRRPLVEGGHRVPAPGGGYGIVMREQPEAMALLRWSVGEWVPEDKNWAQRWRKSSLEIDLDGFRRRFGPARQPVETMEDVKQLVSCVLSDDSLQYFLLTLLLDECTNNKQVRAQVLSRWRGATALELRTRAPYAYHCVKTMLTFYLSLGGGFVGTKSTNKIDVEYLYYLPFVSVFISGDKRCHDRLAPLLLDTDQSYVESECFRDALVKQGEYSKSKSSESAETESQEDDLESVSLIRDLWIKVRGEYRSSGVRSSALPSRPLGETPGSIRKKMEDAFAFIDANPESYPSRRPWPYC